MEQNEIINRNMQINIFRKLKLGQLGFVNDYHSNWNSLMKVFEEISETSLLKIEDGNCSLENFNIKINYQSKNLIEAVYLTLSNYCIKRNK
jgi:hypothetical protein